MNHLPSSTASWQSKNQARKRQKLHVQAGLPISGAAVGQTPSQFGRLSPHWADLADLELDEDDLIVAQMSPLRRTAASVFDLADVELDEDDLIVAHIKPVRRSSSSYFDTADVELDEDDLIGAPPVHF